MTSSLLEKEEEYRKLNEAIEIHTKELMQEVSNVMKTQDILLSKHSPNYTKLDCKTLKQNNFGYIINGVEDKLHYNSKSRNKEDDVKEKICKLGKDDTINGTVPETVEGMGIKGMSHFFRAKIKTMQNDYEKLQHEFKLKSDELKKTQKEVQKIAEEKDKWFQGYNTNKTQISKFDNQITALQTKIQTKENENASLKKELEQIKRDFKSVSTSLSGAELRLNRTLEENDKMKTILKVAKQDEKELRETHRKQVNELNLSLKRLEKHKTELLNAFKKQLQLIDNLKKQKLYMDSQKLSGIAENEFMKLLEFKIDS